MKRSAVLITGVVAILLAGCGGEEAQVEERQVAVRGIVLEPQDREIVRTYTGTVEGIRQAVIRSKVSEPVQKVHVDEGEVVRQGQILFSLDKTGTSSRYFEVQSLLANAEKNFNKIKYLYEEGAVSESRFDEARTNYEVRKAEFEAISQLVEIPSPINGTVTSVMIREGDYLSMGQEMATVARTDSLRVKFNVNIDDAPLVEPGTRVRVVIEGAADSIEATVTTVARSADPVTRAVAVEATFDNHDGRFRPGTFVRVRLLLERLQQVVVVPRKSLIEMADGMVVFTVAGDRAIRRTVAIGADLEGEVVVQSGLTPGDTLVVVGQAYLEDSTRVKLTGFEDIN